MQHVSCMQVNNYNVPPGMGYGNYTGGYHQPYQNVYSAPYYVQQPYAAGGYSNPQAAGYPNAGMQSYGAAPGYGAGHQAPSAASHGKYAGYANQGRSRTLISLQLCVLHEVLLWRRPRASHTMARAAS